MVPNRGSVFALLFLLLSAGVPGFAKDKKPTAEEIVAKHLESIGNPETLSALKSSMLYGLVSVRRPLGTVPQILPEQGKRKDPNNFLFASAENRIGMLMRFYDQDYPEEHFAYNGKDVNVKIVKANQRSMLGNFIVQYSGLLREGLVGGVLSTSWPLLHLQEGRFKLEYQKTDINGTKLHQLTYAPKKRWHMDNIIVRILLEFDTYRHIMTEYWVGATMPRLALLERFSNFKTVDGITLPYNYSIQDGAAADTIAQRWTVDVRQIGYNQAIDPQIFEAK
jgi:hypothetical protein